MCAQGQRREHEPAAPETQQRDRQKQQDQPRAAVEIPCRRDAFVGRLPRRSNHRIFQNGIEIAAVRSNRHIAPAAGARHSVELVLIKFRQHDSAARIFQKPTLDQRHGSALWRADANHRDAHAGGARTLRGGVGVAQRTVGKQHDLAIVKSRAFDELHAKIDRLADRIASDGHDRRIERIDQIRHCVRVVGQRRDDECLAGIGDECGLRIAAAFQDIGDLEARTFEPARLDVLRRHGRSEFEHNHARRPVLIQRLRQLFPRRTGERETGNRPGDDREPARQRRWRGVVTAHQKVFEQMRIDHAAPRARVRAASRQRHPNQWNCGERDQPPCAQEMEIAEQAVHRAHSGFHARQRSRDRIMAVIAINIANDRGQ